MDSHGRDFFILLPAPKSSAVFSRKYIFIDMNVRPKKHIVPCRRIAVSITVALTLSAAVDTPAETVDSVLAFYESEIRKHPHFTTRFTQRRYMSLFDTPLVSEGTLKFSYPDRILLHYTEPFESIIFFMDGTIRRYLVKEGKHIEQPSLEIVAKAVTREMARWLSGSFTKNFPYTVTIDDTDSTHLVCTPENPAAQALFSAIHLFFVRKPVYIEKVKLIEQSGDSLVIEHEKPSFGKLSDDAFAVPGK
jgi:outer membrane lipoprotein-sorting protein